MLVMNQYHVISQRVTTTDLVTTSFADNLSTSAVMLPLQVFDYNANPENNKTKHTNKIFIQTSKFSINRHIPMQINMMPYMRSGPWTEIPMVSIT